MGNTVSNEFKLYIDYVKNRGGNRDYGYEEFMKEKFGIDAQTYLNK